MLGALRSNARWIAIGGLIILNAALIAALIVRHSATATSAVPAGVPAVSPAMSPSDTSRTASTPTPAPTASPSAPESPGPASTPSRLLTANSATIAWRAERGGCGERAVVEVTTNGGKTWRRVDPQLRALVRLQAYGDHSVFAVGADAACRPAYTSTESPDRRWHSAPVVWDTWFSDPKDPARVHAPGGRTSRPCGDAVRAFSATSTAGAAVICGDGRVRVSTTGRTWRTIQSRSTAVALGSSDRGLLLAYPSASCQGVVVRKLRATTSGGSCADELDAVAIAGHGTITWAWVGDHMSVR